MFCNAHRRSIGQTQTFSFCRSGLASNRLRCRAGAPRILQPEGYKARIIQMWGRRGASYDASDTFHLDLATQLVELSDIRPGHAVLDAATGTGMVALHAAERVGDTGHVLGVDISDSMLTEARQKAERLGLSNVRWLCADMEAVDLDMGAYDRILCSSAMLYFQDLQGMLRRCFDWLKPGGRLCFNTPQEPCVPATLCFYRALEEATGMRLADAAAPLGTADRVQAACQSCGFSSVQVTSSEEVILYKNASSLEYAEKIWRSLTSAAIMTPLEGAVAEDVLRDHVKPRYLKEVATLAQPWSTAEGLANPYTMLWAVAEKAA